jgi:hypothetical protein
MRQRRVNYWAESGRERERVTAAVFCCETACWPQERTRSTTTKQENYNRSSRSSDDARTKTCRRPEENEHVSASAHFISGADFPRCPLHTHFTSPPAFVLRPSAQLGSVIRFTCVCVCVCRWQKCNWSSAGLGRTSARWIEHAALGEQPARAGEEMFAQISSRASIENGFASLLQAGALIYVEK